MCFEGKAPGTMGTLIRITHLAWRWSGVRKDSHGERYLFWDLKAKMGERSLGKGSRMWKVEWYWKEQKGKFMWDGVWIVGMCWLCRHWNALFPLWNHWGNPTKENTATNRDFKIFRQVSIQETTTIKRKELQNKGALIKEEKNFKKGW